jgi:hypothetical protein
MGWEPEVLRPKGYLFFHGNRNHLEIRILEDSANMAGQLTKVTGGDIQAVYDNLPLQIASVVVRDYTVDATEQGCLASAGRSSYPNEFACAHGQLDILQGRNSPSMVAKGQVLYLHDLAHIYRLKAVEDE